jgi:hypothetical protein
MGDIWYEVLAKISRLVYGNDTSHRPQSAVDAYVTQIYLLLCKTVCSNEQFVKWQVWKHGDSGIRKLAS